MVVQRRILIFFSSLASSWWFKEIIIIFYVVFFSTSYDHRLQLRNFSSLRRIFASTESERKIARPPDNKNT